MTPLQKLQVKLGVTPDNSFGPKTFKAFMKKYNMSANRAAHFFGQVAHECGNFTVYTENLNYSVDGLLKTFPKYFPTEEMAKLYARKPEKIANKVYANRMGNGPETSGDGWKYRGRGALQTTGKSNYSEFSKSINRPDIIINPDPVADDLAFDAAMFFFTKNNLWAICDKGIDDATITQLTKKINGGVHGLADRKAKTKLYASWA